MAAWRLFLSHVKKYFTYLLCSLIKILNALSPQRNFTAPSIKLYNILHLLLIINGKKTFLAGKYHGFCKHITHFAGKQ